MSTAAVVGVDVPADAILWHLVLDGTVLAVLEHIADIAVVVVEMVAVPVAAQPLARLLVSLIDLLLVVVVAVVLVLPAMHDLLPLLYPARPE